MNPSSPPYRTRVELCGAKTVHRITIPASVLNLSDLRQGDPCCLVTQAKGIDLIGTAGTFYVQVLPAHPDRILLKLGCTLTDGASEVPAVLRYLRELGVTVLTAYAISNGRPACRLEALIDCTDSQLVHASPRHVSTARYCDGERTPYYDVLHNLDVAGPCQLDLYLRLVTMFGDRLEWEPASYTPGRLIPRVWMRESARPGWKNWRADESRLAPGRGSSTVLNLPETLGTQIANHLGLPAGSRLPLYLFFGPSAVMYLVFYRSERVFDVTFAFPDNPGGFQALSATLSNAGFRLHQNHCGHIDRKAIWAAWIENTDYPVGADPSSTDQKLSRRHLADVIGAHNRRLGLTGADAVRALHKRAARKLWQQAFDSPLRSHWIDPSTVSGTGAVRSSSAKETLSADDPAKSWLRSLAVSDRAILSGDVAPPPVVPTSRTGEAVDWAPQWRMPDSASASVMLERPPDTGVFVWRSLAADHQFRALDKKSCLVCAGPVVSAWHHKVAEMRFDLMDATMTDLMVEFYNGAGREQLPAALQEYEDFGEDLELIPVMVSCARCGWWCLGLKSGNLPGRSHCHAALRAFDINDTGLMNAEIIEHLSRQFSDVYALSPRRFEEVVAAVYRSAGYRVRLTQQSRDGGVDLICLEDDTGRVCIVECKRYAANRSVGIAAVQRLVGVKMLMEADRAQLVTSSRFSLPARERATKARRIGLELDLVDAHELLKLLTAYRDPHISLPMVRAILSAPRKPVS